MNSMFEPRQTPVCAKHGMVASSQVLASETGIGILKRGGNAADAAVAVAAVLSVIEPCSTGLGGDCFCLFYDAGTGKVRGINGSGRAPHGLSVEMLNKMGIRDKLSSFSVHTVTVPGAPAGWVDTVERFGTMELSEILAPAISLAHNGFSVSPLTAIAWEHGVNQLLRGPYANELLINGKAPMAGEIMKNPYLESSLQELSMYGKSAFYEGRIAEEIVEICRSKGGFISLEDLACHHSTFDEPIMTNYRGMDIYEMPPNGQGMTALIALNIIEGFDVASMVHSSTEYLHTLFETLKLAFADTQRYIADPAIVRVPTKRLLSKEYATERRKLFRMDKVLPNLFARNPPLGADTVYFCMVDKKGNACSFINSNYMGFGTGLVPKGCGFSLQNRGANFTLDPSHPNCLAPGKRPYHTIIPGMVLMEEELFAPFGVMGGFMQPQGHVQVLINMIDFEMDPQQALDSPRFCIKIGASNNDIAVEEGINETVLHKLSAMGHQIVLTSGYSRTIFGRGQIIVHDPKTGILRGGTDPRADGAAIGW